MCVRERDSFTRNVPALLIAPQFVFFFFLQEKERKLK